MGNVQRFYSSGKRPQRPNSLKCQQNAWLSECQPEITNCDFVLSGKFKLWDNLCDCGGEIVEMGVEQFPMFRLATLLARQLSSPIATRIKTYATTHPRVRKQVIARIGRWYHNAELRFKMWTLRLQQPDHMPTLSEAQAVQSGADIMGEMVIFGLGSAIIIFEVNRQADKQEMKVLNERSEWVAILVGLEELQRELALQQQDMDRLWTTLDALAPGALSPPPPPPPLPPLPETKTETKPQEAVSSETKPTVDSTLNQTMQKSAADSAPILPTEKSTLSTPAQKPVVDVTPTPPMQKSAVDLTPKPSPPALPSTLTPPMLKSAESSKQIPPPPTSAKDCLKTPPSPVPAVDCIPLPPPPVPAMECIPKSPPTVPAVECIPTLPPPVPAVECIPKSPPTVPAVECIPTPPPESDEDCTPAPPDLAAECIPP